jgi:hypothetical protein
MNLFGGERRDQPQQPTACLKGVPAGGEGGIWARAWEATRIIFPAPPLSRDQIRIRLHCTAAASPSGLSRQCIKRRRKATQRQRQCILPAFT